MGSAARTTSGSIPRGKYQVHDGVVIFAFGERQTCGGQPSGCGLFDQRDYLKAVPSNRIGDALGLGVR
jgi:hypothetical protein